MSDAVQILVGDCRATLAGLAAGSVRCIVTSPPYNLGASPSAGNHPHSARGSNIPDWSYETDPDTLPELEYQAQQLALLDALWAVSTPDASIFYVHKDRTWGGRSISPRTWLDRSRWQVRQQIIWDRKHTHNMNEYYCYQQNEWVFWLKKIDTHWKLGKYAAWGTIWRIEPETRILWHPCPFPELLAERCILLGSQPGDTVLDPYAGAGTVGKVARELGRNAILMERQPRYVNGIYERLGAFQPRLFLEEAA